MNLLIWRIVGRASAPAQRRPLPSAVLTVGPAFRHESLPPEVALLLPTTAGADGLSAALATMPATGLATGLERFADRALGLRSEEHTSELQSLMRTSYSVFCLKKKTTTRH